MSQQNTELHQSKNDIFFMVIFAILMTIIYCERLIKDIMIFYDYNLIDTLTKRVEVYFCLIVGFSLIIVAMDIEKSQAERISKWFKKTIRLKLTKQNLLVFIIIILLLLFDGIVNSFYFFNIFFDYFKDNLVILILFVIFLLLALLMIKILGNGEKNTIAKSIKQFVLGVPFLFLWWCIYYFIIYGTSLKSHMTDYAYNNGLIKDSIFYTVIAIFVNAIYKLKLAFPKLSIERKWQIFSYLAVVALAVSIFSIYLDLKYNERVIYQIENYEQKEKLADPLIYQVIKEYPQKRDLELVSKHIFRRDFLIIVPFIIIIFSWLVWNIYSVPCQIENKKRNE